MAKIALLQDAFAGSILDATKWEALNGAPTTLDAHRVVLPATTDFPEIRSVDLWDLTFSQLAVATAPPPPLIGLSYTMELQVDSDNLLAIEEEEGQLTYRIRTGGDDSETVGPYDAARQVWWRIREAYGYVYFDTSADGVFWETQLRNAHTLDLTAVTVRVYCGGEVVTPTLSGWGSGGWGDGPFGG